MRGVNQKKHRVLHDEGNLELQIRPMAYKGTSIAWMRNLNLSEQEDWSNEPAIPDGPIASKRQLKQIACPKCGYMKSIEDYKVRGRVGFSMMTCKRCRNTKKYQR